MKASYIGSLLAGWLVLTPVVGAAQIDYTYDAAGRLIKADYGSGTGVEYTYDANGNLLLRSASSGGHYMLIYQTATGGSILGAATQTIAHGASGTAVTALTNRYFRFVEWGDGRTVAARTDTNVTANAIIIANFAALMAAQGTPQWWLASHGYTSNFDAAELSDSDADGFTARQEYIADTNPTNAASFLRIVHIDDGPPVVVYFEPGSTGRLYTLQFSTNVMKGHAWTPVPGSLPRMGHGGNDVMTDTTVIPARAHRIVVEHP